MYGFLHCRKYILYVIFEITFLYHSIIIKIFIFFVKYLKFRFIFLILLLDSMGLLVALYDNTFHIAFTIWWWWCFHMNRHTYPTRYEYVGDDFQYKPNDIYTNKCRGNVNLFSEYEEFLAVNMLCLLFFFSFCLLWFYFILLLLLLLPHLIMLSHWWRRQQQNQQLQQQRRRQRRRGHDNNNVDDGSLSMGILCKCFSLFLAFSAPSFYRVLSFFDTASK